MNANEMLLPLIDDPVARAIGWALLHFVWQGALVGVLAAVALALLRRSDADVRYVVAAIALAVMATLPVVTAVQSYERATAAAPTAVPLQGGTALVAPPQSVVVDTLTSAPPAAITPSPSPLLASLSVEPWLPMFVLGWLVGVAFLTLRLFSGWLWVQRMKSHGARVAGHELQASVARLSKRLHIYRPVRLLESAGVDVPTVIGCIKPVILLPVSALAGLSHSQVEAILAHELAHIRRHDYLVNLLQTLLETLLFYHPAVWWLSRRIRAEREHCCDDLAVSLCGDPVAYARALADLEELRGAPARLVLAASGGPLLHRVRRLLLTGPTTHDGRGPVWLAGATALLLVFGIGVTAISGATSAGGDQSGFFEQYPPAPPPPPPPQPALPAPAPMPPPPPPPMDPVATPPVAETPDVPAAPPAPAEPPMPPMPPVAMAPPAPPAGAVAPPPPPPAIGMPSPPAPPVPAPAPPPPAQRKSSGNHIVWNNDRDKLEIRWDGEFEFTDDDTDVKTMTPGSQMRISDGPWLRGKSVELSADASGNITRRYWVGSNERPFDPEGKQWLATKLPDFIRQSAIGAASRVARIHKNGGVNAVLAEITRITSSYAKRIYFNELFKMDINADARRRGLEQAGRELTSDYELASLLIANGDRFFADDGTRKAYFDAARGIDSDYEMRRVFSSAVKRGALDAPLLGAMLDAARSIGSDYELASLLVQVAGQQSIEPARAPFFAALSSIGSDYEHARVLLSLAGQAQMSDETMLALLRSVKGMSSGYEASRVLQSLAAKHAITGAARDAYIDATQRLGDYEQGRALTALVKNDRGRR